MANMRELKNRINSVHSSQKITGAMKMISSARLRKAENKLAQAFPYRQKLWEIYSHLQKTECGYISPLAEIRKVKRAAIVVLASDNGLCGAFNLNVHKKLQEVLKAYRIEGIEDITIYPVGKKIMSNIQKLKNITVIEQFAMFGEKDCAYTTRRMTEEFVQKFLEECYDRVEVLYTYYKSMGTQYPCVRRFLPVTLEEDMLKEEKFNEPWYILEPSAKEVLVSLYPRLLHALMYEIFISNTTSEQAARILAMQMANDNAVKLLGTLQLEYNKLRQQGITTELLDIAGGSIK